MRRRRLALVGLCCLLPTASRADCEPWCSEPCEVLNGNVEEECNDCTDEFACQPGATGYTTWKERVMAHEKEVSSVAVEADGTTHEQVQQHQVADDAPVVEPVVEPVIEAETVPCQILESADVQGKSGVELHTLLSRPTIIRGLIDHWPAHERFGSDATGLQSPGLDAFATAFGNHTLLAKRANFARQACERAGADDWATLVPFTDVFPHL